MRFPKDMKEKAKQKGEGLVGITINHDAVGEYEAMSYVTRDEAVALLWLSTFIHNPSFSNHAEATAKLQLLQPKKFRHANVPNPAGKAVPRKKRKTNTDSGRIPGSPKWYGG